MTALFCVGFYLMHRDTPSPLLCSLSGICSSESEDFCWCHLGRGFSLLSKCTDNYPRTGFCPVKGEMMQNTALL